MKIKFLSALVGVLVLFATQQMQAERIFILFDEGCMERLEYNHNRPDGRNDHIVYHVNIRSGEKLILEVGEEGDNEQNYVPTPTVSCANGGLDQSMMRRVNANIDEVYVVYPKNNQTYIISPVKIASYYTKRGSFITYESPKYQFRFNTEAGTIGENIAQNNNPGVKTYFEGRLENDCSGAYLFRQLNPSSAYPLIDLVLTPEIGITEERSGPNASAALNNAIIINKINNKGWEKHLRAVCGTEPGSNRSVIGSSSPQNYGYSPAPNTGNGNLPAGAIPLGGARPTIAARGSESATLQAPPQQQPAFTPAPAPAAATTTTAAPAAAAATHTVSSGETLWGISSKYGATVTEVKNWNNLSSNMIRRGQVLQVAAPTQQVAQQTTQPQPEPSQGFVARGNTLPVPYTEGAAANRINTDDQSLHVVQPGETVASLAIKYGYTETKFREINDMKSNDYIRVGQRLRTSDCNCPSEVQQQPYMNQSSTPSNYGSTSGRLNPTSLSARTPTPTTSNYQPALSGHSGTAVTGNSALPQALQTRQASSIQAQPNPYDAIIPSSYQTTPSSMSDLESGNRAIMPQNTNDYMRPATTQPSSYNYTPTNTYSPTNNYGNYNSGYGQQQPSTLNNNPDEYYQQAENQRRVHIVQEGESLYGISRRYGVTPEQLRKLNNLGPNAAIIPFQTLYLD